MSNGIYWWIIFFDNLLLRIFAEVRVPVVRIIWSIDLSEFNLLNKGNIDKLSPILAAWNQITIIWGEPLPALKNEKKINQIKSKLESTMYSLTKRANRNNK